MLSITIPKGEFFIESDNIFIYTKEQVLKLEHSLVSISKWESKWNKPFLSKETKTDEETIDYIKCMTLTQNVDPNVYLALSDENIREVRDYIEAPMTATWFKNENKGGNNQIITSERIYYWLITLNIPFECQKWHLNRLLTLIQVCDLENSPKKKMSKKELMDRNRELNDKRKRELNTNG